LLEEALVCVILVKLFAFELAGKKHSRADFTLKDIWISHEIFPNCLFQREIGSAVFLSRPTQKQTTLPLVNQHIIIHVMFSLLFSEQGCYPCTLTHVCGSVCIKCALGTFSLQTCMNVCTYIHTHLFIHTYKNA
jgi:hypothetical protein